MSGATNRRRGDYFERQTRGDLERWEWFVIRSAGSFGPFDLVALKRGRITALVSCKLSGKITKADIVDAIEIADSLRVFAVLACRPVNGRVTYKRLCYDPDGRAVSVEWLPYDSTGRTLRNLSHVPPETHGSDAG